MAPEVIVRGVRLALHPEGDYVSDVIRRTGDFYEADILRTMADRITGGTVIDVGAMIGNHAAFMAQFVPTARIHAFEPVPANLALLVRNVEPYTNVGVYDVALSDRRGMDLMTVDPANMGHAVLGGVDAENDIAVPTRTLDSYRFRDVRLLKVDVEGHEPRVLAGARQTIERYRPLIVIEDWSGPPSIDGYRVAVSWEEAHQTYLLEPVG